MATQIEQILGKDINSLKELREEIKRLQDSIAAIDPATQEFKDTTVKLTAAQEQLTAVTRAGKDGNDAAKDSIVGMEREYKSLYNTYKMLTEEQRNSDFGKEMAASLNTLSTKLNETKKGVGNFKDNIGRYSESVIDAFSKMGGSVGGLVGPFATATKGVMGFNAALKANPVGAVITLIMTLINAVKALKDSINGNEESQMRWNQAMASFQPIIDAVKNAMDRFAQTILSVVEFIAKVVDKIRVAKAAFTDFLGITKGAKDAVKEQQKTYKELAKSVNDLTKTRREAQKQNAADEAEVQRLREEASETTNLVEKKELLQQAKEKQAEIDQRNIEIAKEELRILEEQSKLTSNSAADNEKLAAAVAKVAEAEATAANNARAFNKQLGNGSTATTTITTATKNYREEAKKLYEELVEANKTEIQKLTEKYNEEKKLLEKYHLDTKLLTKKYGEDIAKIEKDNWEKQKQERLRILKEKGEFETSPSDVRNSITNSQELFNIEQAYDNIVYGLKRIKTLGTETEEEWIRNIQEIVEATNVMFKTDFKLPPITEGQSFRSWENSFYDYLNDIHRIIKEKNKSLAKEFWDKEYDRELAQTIADSLEADINLQLDAIQNGISQNGFDELVATNEWEALNAQKKVLEEEITNFKGTQDKKIELMQQYYEIVAQMREKDWAAQELMAERERTLFQNKIEFYDSVCNSINTVIGSVNSLIQAQINDTKTTKAEKEKKIKILKQLEWVSFAATAAQIVGSTASGIMGVWEAYGKELAINAQTAAATGPAAAATKAALDAKSLLSAKKRTTTIALVGAANLASAAIGSATKQMSLNAQLEGLNDDGGGAAGTAATPMEIDSTPYTYTRTLQTVDEEDELNRPVWVSVEDISSAIGKRARVSDESSF